MKTLKVPRHIETSADLSDDCNGPDGRGEYRYSLWRRKLLADDPGAFALHQDSYLLGICLNPSTADEHYDDPTVQRCWRRARRLGYGAFCMANLFAFRATEPMDMKLARHPAGEWNDDWITMLARGAGEIMLGWGTDGAWLDRDMKVLMLLEPWIEKLRYLTLTMRAAPGHPLYLSDALHLQPVKPVWRNILQRKAL